MTSTSTPTSEVLDRRAVRGAGSPVTGMTIFVASEAVFFAVFFGIYMTAYTSAKVWPPSGVTGPGLIVPTVAVAVVLASGLTMSLVLRAVRRSEVARGMTVWLAATLVCAVAFGVLLAIGYQDVGFGVGQGIYESLFYMITGLELAHVVGGVALLGLVLARVRTGEVDLHRDPVLAAGIYWYFVVVLAVVIYLVLYLASAG